MVCLVCDPLACFVPCVFDFCVVVCVVFLVCVVCVVGLLFCSNVLNDVCFFFVFFWFAHLWCLVSCACLF